MRKLTRVFAPILLALCLLLSGCGLLPMPQADSIGLNNLPAYSDSAYVEIENNEPDFSDADKQITDSFEEYSELDLLGRCGEAYACVSTDLMPAQNAKRGSISGVTPTGWQNVKYALDTDKKVVTTFVLNTKKKVFHAPDCKNVDTIKAQNREDYTGVVQELESDKYKKCADCISELTWLYNRCHLIGWQLTAENANKQNLITGTRYLNISGMLPFENMVADYIKETGNHVLYRVTPIYEGNNLVASGVQMEGWSVEDDGDGICYNVYCYNVQPGVEIDYATGESRAA